MRKVTQYYLLYCRTAEILSETVNYHLANGYELYGQPFNRNDGVVQAVVKYEDVSEAIDYVL